ncbi:DUF1398 family protein [Schlesneria paludicola]|uniref:DUF1398 family protein n=1 Tax=Schlesneria paludicola TaxID=360056 RepID=UPI00029A9146|nr:DUF1398 family protein [Schlesneria paludicola]
MNQAAKQTIIECSQASAEGRIHFGEVVSALIQAGVESYYVDYRACRTTYYFPCGDTLTLDNSASEAEIGESFDGAAIQAAIRGAQQGTVMYPEFKRLSQKAGCASYAVWIAGKHVAYYGRRGETHVERFPS